MGGLYPTSFNLGPPNSHQKDQAHPTHTRKTKLDEAVAWAAYTQPHSTSAHPTRTRKTKPTPPTPKRPSLTRLWHGQLISDLTQPRPTPLTTESPIAGMGDAAQRIAEKKALPASTLQHQSKLKAHGCPKLPQQPPGGAAGQPFRASYAGV